MEVCEDVREQGVAEIMTPEVLCVYEGWSVARLARFLSDHQIGGAPVIASDHTLVGVVSLTDILRFQKLSGPGKQEIIEQSAYLESLGQSIGPDTLEQIVEHADDYATVNSIMTRKVLSVDRAASVSEVSRIMVTQNVRRVFVTEGEKMVGVVTAGNVLACLYDHS